MIQDKYYHYILYARGQYPKDDTIIDLFKIAAHILDIEHTYITIDKVISGLSYVANDLTDVYNLFYLTKTVQRLYPTATYQEVIIHTLLNIIHDADIQDIIIASCDVDPTIFTTKYLEG